MHYLPYSNKRYYVIDTSLYENTTGTKIQDNNGYVRITWINGDDSYELALLVLLALKKPSIHPDLLMHVKTIRPLKIDMGIDIENLDYVYKSTLEVPGYPGFYYVPSFSTYAVTKDGRVMNLETKKLKKFSKLMCTENGRRKSGYYYLAMIDDYGKSVKVYRHRLMCLAFKDLPDGYAKLVVNHLDGEPGNDELDNLELTTHTANIQHAWDNDLISVRPIEMRNLDTSEYRIFNTVAKAVKITGFSYGTLRTRLKAAEDVYYDDGYQFRYKSDTPWKEPLEGSIRRAKWEVAVTAYDVINNKVHQFPSVASMARTLNLHHQTTITGLYSGRTTPMNGYVIAYTDKFEIPVYSEDKMRVFKKNGCRDGKMCKVHCEDKLVFEGLVADYSRETGTDRGIVYSALAKGTLVGGKYRFTLLE